MEGSAEIPGMIHYFKVNWTVPKEDFEIEEDRLDNEFLCIESLKKKNFFVDGILNLNFFLNLECRECTYLVKLNTVQCSENVFNRDINLEYAYIASQAGVFDLTWFHPSFPRFGGFELLSHGTFCSNKDYLSLGNTITIHCRVRVRSEVFPQVEDTGNRDVKYVCAVPRKFPENGCYEKMCSDYLLGGKIPDFNTDMAIQFLKLDTIDEKFDFLKTLSVNYLLKNLREYDVVDVLECSIQLNIACLTSACLEVLKDCSIERRHPDSAIKSKLLLPVVFS